MKRLITTFAALVFVVTICNMVLAQSGNAQASGKTMLVNINTANQAELEKLPGIGPSLARRIVEFRQKNGNFKTTAELVAVPGIGEKKYEQLKSMITVK